MNLSVKQRIALAMSAVLVANAAAAVFSWVWYTRASEFARAARTATSTARAAATASQRVAEFMSDANGVAAFVNASARPEASTALYGATLASGHDVDLALVRLGSSADAAALTRQWGDARLVAYAWINAEAARAGSPVRIRTAAGGRYRVGVSSDLALPADLAGLDEAGLRDAARARSEALLNRALRLMVRDADARALAAASAEDRARVLAADGSAALLIVSLLAAAGAATWIYRSIARPLAEARSFAQAVAGGDLRATLARHSPDEIGTLTRAVSEMKDAVVHRVDIMREMAGAVLVTADGVALAAAHAGSVARSLPEAEDSGLAADVDDVTRRAQTLVGLAEQMLSE